MTLPKHIREAIRQAGVCLSDVTFKPRPGHPLLLVDGRRISCSGTPKDPHTAALRIARDLRKAVMS